MRRVVVALLAFALLWVLPAPAASAATATALYRYGVADLGAQVAGRSTGVSAVLLSGPDDAPMIGRQLSVSVKQFGSTVFTPVGDATTGAEGVATTSLVLDQSAIVRWDFAGDDSYAPSTTEYLVPVSSRVDLRANHRSLHRGQRLVVRGRTFPVKPGCTVRLWRGELRPLVQGPEPVRLAVARVRADGRFRLVHRFHARGRMRVAVTVGACAGNDRGLSSYLRVRVR